jgi:hypothetical protein
MIETGAYGGRMASYLHLYRASNHATLGFDRSLVADQGNPSPKRKVRFADNPHLTRRWPFGRVTEGLPTIQPDASCQLQQGQLNG